MAGFDQRVTNRSHTALTNRFSKGDSSAVSTSQGTAKASGSSVQSGSHGMQFFRGQVLHGEIIDLQHHNIKVQLAGDRVLSGHIADTVQLSIGEEASFRVMDATASSVSLKVVSDQSALSGELTIDKALEAAGLPKSDHNAGAVRALLEQGLSIDKSSIQNLLRQAAAYRGVSFQTLAAMAKNKLPMTELNASQLEAYQNQEHRIISQLEQTAEKLSDSLQTLMQFGRTAEADALNHQLLTLLLSNQSQIDSSQIFDQTAAPAALLDAPLSSFPLFDNDGLISLLDTLDSLGFASEQTAAVASGTASLSTVCGWIFAAADTLGSPAAGQNADNPSAIAGSPDDASPVSADSMSANNTPAPAGTSIFSAFRSLLSSAGSLFTAAGASAPETGAATVGVGTSVSETGAATVGVGASVPETGAATVMSAASVPETGAATVGVGASVPDTDAATVMSGTSVPDTDAAMKMNAAGQLNNKPASSSPVSGMILSDAMQHLPQQLQTPEIFALLGTYAALARSNSLLSSYLPKQQRVELASSLRHKLPGTVLDKLENGDLTTADLLRFLLEAESSGSQEQNDRSYLASQIYQDILKQQLMDRFSLTPEKLNQQDALKKYYDRLDHDFRTLEQLSTGRISEHSFQESAAGVRDNIDFMKTLNQLFPYVQLPLKLSEQYAHAELYVYRRKEAAAPADDAVRVLLHLDMEQLGPVDVHLQLNAATEAGTELQASFYLPDKAAAQLTTDNLSLLSHALAQKGIQLSAHAEIRTKDTNLVQDLLSAEKNNSSMKRYTFDIRA